MNKKGAMTLIAFLALAVGLWAGLVTLGYVPKPAFLASVVGENVYVIRWGSMQCVQHVDYDVIETKYVDDAILRKCNYETDRCLITAYPDRDLPWYFNIAGAYRVCDLNGNNCGSKISYQSSLGAKQNTLLFERNIEAGQSIKFETGTLYYGEDLTKVTLRAKQYYIRGVEDGKIYVKEGCTLNNDLKSRVLSDGLNILSPNQYQNYKLGYSFTYTQTYSYLGQKVVCQARQIYKVDTETFKDGHTEKVQGDAIKLVDCCPSEPNCGDDFKFKTSQVSDCSSNTDCPNGGDELAVDATHTIKYTCVSGSCVKSSPIEKECTTTAECIRKFGSGQVCDNYQCRESTTPEYCGDGICQELRGENEQTCIQDCALRCAEGEVLVRKISKEGGLLCWLANIGCVESVELSCQKPYWAWLKWVLIILGVIVGIIVLRPALKMIPYVGRFVP